MYTESKKEIRSFNRQIRSAFRIILILLFWSLSKQLVAQPYPVSVNISVMPPYTSSLYDYINTPNKIVVTLTHNQLDYPDIDLYLRVLITSENGIKVMTEDGYKPNIPISLQWGKSFILTNQNLSDAFNINHTLIEGIDLNELLNGAGLPEDYYQICIQAFDFNNDQSLSPDQPIGCSNLFNITNLDAPIILEPICGDPVPQTAIQMAQIKWNIPPCAPPGTQYRLEIVELPENSAIDPMEAFEASAYPPFYDETTQLNLAMLTIQKTLLTPGFTYAFRVRATDPAGKVRFRNNGYSEVCWFRYGTSQTDPLWENKSIQMISPGYCHPDSVLLAAPPEGLYIGWRLLPFDPQNYKEPFGNSPDHQFRVEFFDQENSLNPVWSTGTDQCHIQLDPDDDQLPLISGQPYWVQISVENTVSLERVLSSDRCAFRYIHSSLSAGKLVNKSVTGSLNYQFEASGNSSYPIGQTELSLKCLYLLSDSNTGRQYEIAEEDVLTALGSEVSFPSGLTLNPVASAVTQSNGLFSIHYSWPENAPLGVVIPSFSFQLSSVGSLTGQLIRAIKIEINNPYYTTPQAVISENKTPFDLGEVIANVFSYDLQANLTKGYTTNSQVREELVGKTVYLFRKQKLPGIPLVEGDRLAGNAIMAIPPEITQAGYYLVASTRTSSSINDQGETVALAHFKHLVENLVGGDEYFWYAQGTPLNSAQPLSFSNNLHLSQFVQSGLNSTSGQSSPQISTQGSSSQVYFLNNSQSTASGYSLSGKLYQSGSGTTGQYQLSESAGFNKAWGQTGTSYTLETSGVSIQTTGSSSFTVHANLNILSDEPPLSVIKGRLVYEFPGKPGNARPLANRQISIISCLVTDQPGQVSKIVKNSQNEAYESAFPDARVILTSSTDANGNFNISFPNVESEKPDPTTGNYFVSTGQLNRTSSWISWESDPETSFRVSYTPVNTKVKRVFRLVVDDPTGLFMSPDNNFTIAPLTTADVGTLTSFVMSYSLNGQVGWNKHFNTQGGTDPNGQPIFDVAQFTALEGIECYVLRKLSEISNYQLPVDEGQNIVGSLEELKDFKIIAKTISGTSGQFKFDNLLFRNCLAPIYLYFKTSDMLGDLNYDSVMANQNILNPFSKPVFLFNSDYDYTDITGFSTAMEPRLPTLKGKVISNVSAGMGVAYASAKAIFTFKSTQTGNLFNLERYCVTDTAGYFDFTPFFRKFDEIGFVEKIEQIKLEVKKVGFHYMKGNLRQDFFEDTYMKDDFKQGRQKVVQVNLSGNGTIKGRIVNEQDFPVDAYVQFFENRMFNSVGGEGTMAMTNTSDNPIYNLFCTGKFEIPAIPGNNRKLMIIPKDVAYFPDTLIINVSDNAVTDLGKIVVFERAHRLALTVKGVAKVMQQELILPLKGAKVELIGSPGSVISYSDATGKVILSFKNVSESNLSLKVSGPSGSGYVPKIMSFTNYESDQIVQLPDVTLKKGLTVKGKVMLDGKPTSDAEIYLELSYGQSGMEFDETSQGEQSKTESAALFKTYPQSDGSFELNTIPPELEGQQVVLKAVYKKRSQLTGTTSGRGITENQTTGSDATIVGDIKSVIAPNTSGNLTFNLTSYKAMKIQTIWGFPVEITRIQPQTGGQKAYVSGRIKLEGYSPGFDPLESLNLEFDNVLFRPSPELTDKVPVGVPDQNEVIVSLKRELKLRYNKAFNVKLSAPGNSLFKIIKDPSGEETGLLQATVAIVDNSFQFPGSYLNFEGVNFNLCRKRPVNNLIQPYTPVIEIFKASTPGNGNTNARYNLCNLSASGLVEGLKFKFIDFDTRSEVGKSAIEGDEIILAPKLSAEIKDAGKIEVNIDKLVLKNNAIATVSGQTPINIELKDGGIYDADKTWRFEARNWRLDPKVGGIQSEDCILHTGSIDIPFSYFNLRSQFAYIGEPQPSEINLGGYPITFTKLGQENGAKVAVGYNPSCGSDRKGHWQVIFYPPANGDAPAKVYGLPNMNNAVLELETVSLLSNGENVFSIGTGAKTMKLYKTVEFRPQTVFSLPDGLVLGGIASFHIPRVRDQIGVRLVFEKNSDNTVNPRFDPIDLAFDGRGNIKFQINPVGQVFDAIQHTFSTQGFIQEPGVLAPVPVMLTYYDKTPVSAITTQIVESPHVPNIKVKIGEENSLLEHVTCRTKANQDDWDLFVFEGDLAGVPGLAANSNRHMVFTVHGEIKASQDEFKAEGINANFDGIDITYQNGRLIGNLTLNNVPLGTAIVSGSANLLLDKDGWAFYSNCRASGVPAPDPCTLNMGILIGDYPAVTSEMKSVVLQYAVKKGMPETFNQGLHGFYLIGGRELPISGLDIGIDVVVASAYVRVPIAALDAAFYMNCGQGSTVFGTSISGGLRVEFGLGSITCTDLSGFGSAIVNLKAEANTSGSLNLEGSATFDAGLTVTQGIPVPLSGCQDAVDISVPISGRFGFKTSPSFKVNFSID